MPYKKFKKFKDSKEKILKDLANASSNNEHMGYACPASRNCRSCDMRRLGKRVRKLLAAE